MAEFTNNNVQAVALNGALLFNSSIPCTKGYVLHENDTGNFYLRGCTPNCFARYQVTFNGNIAIPTGGAITPIAVAISVDGEVKQVSTADFVPTAVDTYGNVTSTTIVTVPRDSSRTIAVRYVDATVDDAATTPTPSIEVKNASLVITRIA